MPNARYPAYDESAELFYNVPRNSGPKFLRAIPRHCSVPDPPPLPAEFREYWILRRALEAWLPGHLKAGILWPHAISIGEPSWDRTLQTAVGELRELTLEWLAALQEFLRVGWPLWRVIVFVESEAVTVYPTVLRIPGVPDGTPLEQALSTLTERGLAQQFHDPHRQRLKIISRRFEGLLALDPAERNLVVFAGDVEPAPDDAGELGVLWIAHPAAADLELLTPGPGMSQPCALEAGLLRDSPILADHRLYARQIWGPVDLHDDLVLELRRGETFSLCNLGPFASLVEKHRVQPENDS